MLLLGNLGVGDALTEASIDVGGVVEASYTFPTSNPPDDIIAGRVRPRARRAAAEPGRPLRRAADRLRDPWDLGGRLELLYASADARFTASNGLFDYDGFEDGPENQFDITQAYGEVVIPVGTGLKTKVGKFITPLGYELVNPAGNALFSPRFLFGILPYAHTGVLATYQLTEQVQVSGGISRGWDQALEDNNDALDFIGSVGYTLSDETSLFFNFTTGPEQPDNNGRYRTAFDFYATHQLSDQLTLAVNADYVFDARAGQDGDDAHVYGVAGYAGYEVSEQVTVNTRLEWFNDTSRVNGFDAVLYEATLGLSITPFAGDDVASNLKVRPEVRWDYADNDVFDDGTDDQQLTLGVDAYFTF